jgi:hypothetical protein
MKKLLKWLGIGFIVLIVIGVATGSSKSGNKTTSTTGGTTEQQQVQEPMKITARELADDYDGNQVAAEAKWKDKLVQFSAEISNINDTGLSFTKVASKEYSFTQISCRISDKQQVLSLKNGQTVTVKGTVGSQSVGVIDLKDCSVVQ